MPTDAAHAKNGLSQNDYGPMDEWMNGRMDAWINNNKNKK